MSSELDNTEKSVSFSKYSNPPCIVKLILAMKFICGCIRNIGNRSPLENQCPHLTFAQKVHLLNVLEKHEKIFKGRRKERVVNEDDLLLEKGVFLFLEKPCPIPNKNLKAKTQSLPKMKNRCYKGAQESRIWIMEWSSSGCWVPKKMTEFR